MSAAPNLAGFMNTCARPQDAYDGCASSCRGLGRKGAPLVQFHRVRTILVSAIFAATALLGSVITVLAGDGGGPIPK
jgi:hypothetical protein